MAFKLKKRTKFPADIRGSDPVTVEKAGAVLNVGLDTSAFPATTFAVSATAPVFTATSYYAENASVNHAYTLKARTNVALAYAVPTFKSTKANVPTAVDIWPSGPTPVEDPTNGFSWFDACDADLSTNELTPLRCARLGMTSTGAEIGVTNFNGATTVPLYFLMGSGGAGSRKGQINTSGNLIMGTGADTPVFASTQIQANGGTNSGFTARNSTAAQNTEWFAVASGSQVFFGAATAHDAVVRTNNANVATFVNGGGMFMNGATGSGQGSGTVNATALHVNGARVGSLSVKLTGVNFNSGNTDTQISIGLPTGFTRWAPSTLSISNATGTLTTSTVGLFSSTGGGGTTLLAASAVTVSTASANTANNLQVLFPLSSGNTAVDFTTVQFRVITPQGAARTADVELVYTPIS